MKTEVIECFEEDGNRLGFKVHVYFYKHVLKYPRKKDSFYRVPNIMTARRKAVNAFNKFQRER